MAEELGKILSENNFVPNAEIRIEQIIKEHSGKIAKTPEKYSKILNEIVMNKAYNAAKYAVQIARHDGRKTVKESDVELAQY